MSAATSLPGIARTARFYLSLVPEVTMECARDALSAARRKRPRESGGRGGVSTHDPLTRAG